MVGIESKDEFLIGYSPDGLFEIIMRPVTRPMSGLRIRTPPPPPPRTPSPPPPRTPSPPQFITPLIRPVNSGRPAPAPAIVQAGVDPTVLPFRPVNRVPPARPPPPHSMQPPAGPWNSPPPPVYSPVGGLQVFEAEPMDLTAIRDQTARGIVRPHSESPFIRNTKPKVEEEKDSSEVGDMLPAISCLLDFSKRRGLTTDPQPPMVRTFSTSTPKKTPPPLPRPSSPPRIASRRVLPAGTPRPLPVRSMPSAALGAPPPREEDESGDLPDIPENPLATVNLSMISSLDTYESEDGWHTLDEDEDEDSDVYSEYEYADPYEEHGHWSTTPPPSCNTSDHEVCIPPDWGERIPGPAIKCMCLLCHEEGRHHPVRCKQCGNASGCCSCIWTYMRSKYNSGCPICRYGDPKGNNPLEQRRLPQHRRRISLGGMVVGTRGRGRGRGRPRPQEEEEDREEEREEGGETEVRRGRRGRGRRLRRL